MNSEPPQPSKQISLRRDAWRRWGWFLIRVAQVGLVAAILVRWDSPMLGEFFALKDALVVLVSVILLGKILFDTLFFDRYWP